MGKEQAMQGTAASEERDLLEEASRSRSSAMCRRKSCEGQSGQHERRPRGLSQGAACGDGAGGLEGRAPSCSTLSVLSAVVEASHSNPRAHKQAVDMLLHSSQLTQHKEC